MRVWERAPVRRSANYVGVVVQRIHPQTVRRLLSVVEKVALQEPASVVLIVDLKHCLRKLTFTTSALTERNLLVIITHPTTRGVFVSVCVFAGIQSAVQWVEVEWCERPLAISCTKTYYLVRLIIIRAKICGGVTEVHWRLFKE